MGINYKALIKESKKRKYETLFSVKPELNPVVHCMFHPSEGCDLCEYIKRCQIQEDGVL